MQSVNLILVRVNQEAGYDLYMDYENPHYFEDELDYMIQFYNETFSFTVRGFYVCKKDGRICIQGCYSNERWNGMINGRELYGLNYDSDTNVMTFRLVYFNNCNDLEITCLQQYKINKEELENLPTLIGKELDKWRESQNSA